MSNENKSPEVPTNDDEKDASLEPVTFLSSSHENLSISANSDTGNTTEEDEPDNLHCKKTSKKRKQLETSVTVSHIDFGPISKSDGILAVTGEPGNEIITTDKAEFVQDFPADVLKKYERAYITCLCTKVARLAWSMRKQRCYFVCKERKCGYFRWFLDRWAEYLSDEDIMNCYG